MTINWGTKIFLLYAGFVLLIGVLVWKSTHTKIDLVTEDYYAQELTFQKKLDAENATAGLANKPVMTVMPEAIMIFFPQEFAGKAIQADLQLYNPANAALDKTFTGIQATEGKLKIERKDLPAARYIGKLNWKCEGKTYYQEAPLNLSWK
jgi:hypothetical protein